MLVSEEFSAGNTKSDVRSLSNVLDITFCCDAPFNVVVK